MAVWNKTIITKPGLALYAKAVAENSQVNITDVWGLKEKIENPEAVMEAEDYTHVISLKIANLKAEDNQAILTAQVDNTDISKTVQFSTIAIVALNEQGNEIIYAVVTSDEPETIPSKFSQYKMLRLDIILAHSNADNIHIEPTVVIGVRREDLEAHRTRTPIDHPHGSVTDEHIGERTIGDTTYVPQDTSANTGFLETLLGRIANRIKGVTGNHYWFTPPVITLLQAKKRLDSIEEYVNNVYDKYESDDRYLTKNDAKEKYQPKGYYVSPSSVYYKGESDDRYVKNWNFKDKLLEVLGVRYSIEGTGYICFGPLFGGLIIQWGTTPATEYYNPTMSYFPITFPTKAYGIVANVTSGNDDTNWSANIKDNARFWIYSDGRPNPAHWVAVGR